MSQALDHKPQIDNIQTENKRHTSIWRPAFLVASGWVISNVIVFIVTEWFLEGTAGIKFEAQLGTALLLAILGLLAGFSLSLALWVSQENFIGIHALAYTVLVTILTASMAYVPDGVFILPILFVGLYIGMNWANPDMRLSHIIASFAVWMAIAIIMLLVILMLPHDTGSPLIELIRQCVWSAAVGLFGSAFMFWLLSNAEIVITFSMPQTHTRSQDWEKIYNF